MWYKESERARRNNKTTKRNPWICDTILDMVLLRSSDGISLLLLQETYLHHSFASYFFFHSIAPLLFFLWTPKKSSLRLLRWACQMRLYLCHLSMLRLCQSLFSIFLWSCMSLCVSRSMGSSAWNDLIFVRLIATLWAIWHQFKRWIVTIVAM